MSDASLLCVICRKRRPRRSCPGVNGDICSICCGTEREQSVRCPFDCKYLMEAREREAPPMLSEKDLPYREIKVTEPFLQEHETLLVLVGRCVVDAALRTEGAIDSDVREALDAAVRTYQTRASGLYYETRPDNPIAARISSDLQQEIVASLEGLRKQTGVNSVRDSDVMKMLVFLLRLSFQHDNKRRLGRSFLHFLLSFFPDEPQPTESLIL